MGAETCLERYGASNVRRLLRAVIIGAALLKASGARAGVYYVGPGGNDANPGTASQPFQTITHGASLLTPGATLYVHAGLYAESFSDAIPGGASWASPVTVAAYPGETVTLQPPTGSDRVFTFSSSSSHYIILDGFIMDARNVAIDAVKITYGSAGTAHHIRIQNGEIMNARGDGILVTQDPGHPVGWNEFIRLKVHNNGSVSNLDHGFYIAAGNNLVEHCDIYANLAYGVQVYDGNYPQETADHNIIRYNKIHNNDQGMVLSSGPGNLAYDNLIWDNNKMGVIIDYGATGALVYNNTLFFNQVNAPNGPNGLYVGAGSANAVIVNNIIYQNGVDLKDNGSGTTLTTNLTIDPHFADAAAGDFHLTPPSPAIDAGTLVPGVPDDFDGTARPRGRAYDIGAYEAGGVAPSPVISLSPNMLTFTATVGGSNPANQTLAVSNSGGGTLSWTLSDNQNWLTLSPLTGGNGPTAVTASVNTNGIVAGSYSATITASAPGASNKTVTVTLIVAASPVVDVSIGQSAPINLSQGQTQQFTATVTGTTSTGITWTIAPANLGSITAGGLYTAPATITTQQMVTVIATSQADASKSDSVALTLLAATPSPAILLTPASVGFTAVAGGSNPAARTVAVTNTGGGTLTWSAAPTQSWLSLSPVGGTNSGTVTITANISGRAAGIYTDTLTFTGNASNGIKTVSVTLTITAPQPVPAIDSLTANPASVTAGQSSTLSWTFRGATSLSIDNGVGSVTGLAAASVTPSVTTVYTLTASNGSQAVSKSVTITVNGSGALPAIDVSGWPAVLGLNETLSCPYDPALNVSFLWTFAAAPSAASGVLSSPGLAASVTPVKGGSKTAALATYGLAPGNYVISVQTVDNADPTRKSAVASKTITLASADFGSVRVYPNPWRRDKHESKLVTFDRLPLGSRVKLFTASGRLVKNLPDSTESVTWDLTNDSGDKVASGIYLYLIEAGGQKLRGKVGIVK